MPSNSAAAAQVPVFHLVEINVELELEPIDDSSLDFELPAPIECFFLDSNASFDISWGELTEPGVEDTASSIFWPDDFITLRRPIELSNFGVWDTQPTRAVKRRAESPADNEERESKNQRPAKRQRKDHNKESQSGKDVTTEGQGVKEKEKLDLEEEEDKLEQEEVSALLYFPPSRFADKGGA